ncbi:MAG: hypothetical protein K5989_07615 [Lachnospiraceae bacterium]|nr:hypothetical protein [Lachnospiraceae bacterium]
MSNLSAIGSVGNTPAIYTQSTDTKKEDKKVISEKAAETNENGVTLELSNGKNTVDSAAKAGNTDLIAKLKADADERTSQLRSIVEQLMSGQGKAFAVANSEDPDSMWKFLAEGNFTVDAATKAQAQADIAEGGYWSVGETSDRILDFAKALAGDDPSKAEELFSAFEEGFKQATKSWGKDLPSISQDTYDAVKTKFDEWANSASATATGVATQ